MWLPVMSWRADIMGFVIPVLLALVIVPLTRAVPADDVPLFWKLALEVFIDVAHVYSTLCRTVLDSEACAMNRVLYLMAVPGLLVPTLAVNLVFGTWLGWSLLAYYAMFHFAKQPFGLLCLYKARNGERGAADHQWDYWTCMAGAGLPILLWHAGEFGDFLWFKAEDKKLFSLPSLARGPLWALYGLVPLLWLGRVARTYAADGKFNVGKFWIMSAHYFTWYMGFTNHVVRHLAFIDLFHGFSSMVLVYHVVQQRFISWRERSPSSMTCGDRLGEALVSSPWAYLGLLLGLACVEELAWEVLVHQEYLPGYGYKLPELSDKQEAVATSVLMLPQLSHYFLDAFIWKMGPRNPGLKQALVGAWAAAPAAGAPAPAANGLAGAKQRTD
mmetsp:Transcript_38904/g.120148  ORF Transcript_38904/g.120148 Transcript_38904/m.120148 type:complete len:386 (+) Transcript_38904:70-1227(+)